MPLDILSVVLRSLSFIALFQACGMALFVALFGRSLDASSAPLRRLARAAAIAAIAALLAHYLMEAARMADALSGMFDASLQRMVLRSASSTVLAVRVVGLAIVAAAIGRRNDAAAAFCVVGSVWVAGSFLLTGHTLVSPLRAVLAPLLLLHVLVAAFWFGALAPLHIVSSRESPATAARVIHDFSRLAAWLVPCILGAGVVMGAILIPDRSVFGRPYGELLIAKFSGFGLLMGLAVLNKWRLGPAIASGGARACRRFRISLGIEYALLAAVLSVTAVMTQFFSPDT